MAKSHKKIDQHIRGREREPDHVKVGDVLAVQQPPATEKIAPVGGLTWDCQYFILQRYSRQHSGSLSFTESTMTYSHTDSNTTGVYDPSNLTWTDSTKAWTVDEWVDHYLKVDGVYYLIVSNTATVLTIDLEGKDHPDTATAYNIIPFEPDTLIGSFLRPDNTSTRTIEIIDNTETVITVKIQALSTGTVTTGDASAPYNTFSDSARAGVMGDDYWNTYTIKFTSGANNNEKKTVNDYVDSTGSFTTDNFTNAIAVNDTYEIRDDLLWVGTPTFEIQKYMIPKPADFRDTSLVSAGDVVYKPIATAFGELNEGNLPNYINAIYSIKFFAAKTVVVIMPLDCLDSIKITQKNVTNGEVDILVNSKFRQNTVKQVKLRLIENHEYRLDIAFYAEVGTYGFRFMQTVKPLGFYISTWDSALLSPPEWVSISGGDGGGDPASEDREIKLRIQPPADFYGEMT